MPESPDNVKDVEPAQANAVENQKAMREQMLKVLLTSEARERLYKIRMVKPDTAKIIEDNEPEPEPKSEPGVRTLTFFRELDHNTHLSRTCQHTYSCI